MNPEILYEDNHLLVVVKPPNVPVNPDRSRDPDLLQMLKADIKKRYHKPGNVYLGLVHRLDRPAAGVMVFARTSKAASRLSQQLRSGGFRKSYLAVTGSDAVPVQGELEHWLVKDRKTNMVTAVGANRHGARRARLRYTVSGTQQGLTLLRIGLETGRPHQIRVQCAAAGWPLWGDQRYNPAARAGQQLALFSFRLALAHPVAGRELIFTAAPPAVFPWTVFADEWSDFLEQ